MLPFFTPQPCSISIWRPVLLVTCCAAIVVTILFGLFPEWDLRVAARFYDPQQGFIGRHTVIADFLFYSNRYLFLLALVIIMGYTIQNPRNLRATIFLALCLLLGPGLLVNGVLKEYIGRARPDDLLLFGGNQSFSPPWVFADQCATNCSFPSGHAAIGFFWVTLAFIKASSTRRFIIYLTIGLSIGFIYGFSRIYEGRHFLSDVLWSGLLNLLLATLLCSWLFRRPTAS